MVGKRGVIKHMMEQLVLHVVGFFLVKNGHVLTGKHWSGGGVQITCPALMYDPLSILS